MNVRKILHEAVSFHQAGQLGEAEKRYRIILSREPRHADALQLLGLIAHQVGRHAVAAELIQRAIVLSPNVAEYYNNLGQALEKLRRWDEAADSYRRALDLKPGYPEANNNLGNVLKREGRIEEATAAYNTAIKLNPNYGEAYNNLGMLLADQGRTDEAIAAYQNALRLRGEMPEIHLNLGNAAKLKGDGARARLSYRRAIELNPQFAEARNNYGVLLHEQGEFAEGLAELQTAVRLMPENPEAHHNLSLVLKELGRFEEAATVNRTALALRPHYAEAYNTLGNIYKALRRFDEAVECYRAAIQHKPDYPDPYNNLGNLFCDQRRADDAIRELRTAITLNANYAEAYSNLGNALQAKGDIDTAITAYRTSIALKPDFASGYNNLANALKDQGQLDEAIALYRKAIDLDPSKSSYHNLLFTLHYHPAYNSARLAEEHRIWNERFADHLRIEQQSHRNHRGPNRRLRIGYVSADFREHAVARFLLPLLQQHDRAAYEIFCYDNVVQPDAKTNVFRALPHEWHTIVGKSDAAVADLVRHHQIDILVDVSAHSAGNRLLVFARRPAPVQVTWLAYAGTTGLSTVDYRLSDPHLDPIGCDESIYSEKCFRLPETYWCCHAPDGSPEVNRLPAASTEVVTFGCLNNFCKITRPILECWAEILHKVPDSVLLLHAHRGSHRDRLIDWFAQRGIARTRVSFVGSQPLADYLATYHRIDIALDSFPFGGGTTTCDALWMGVPVVSLAGDTAVSRAGASLLANIGLPHLVARCPNQYVQIAVELGRDLPALSELRAALRSRMQTSPLMDAPRFAQNIEAAFSKMWRDGSDTPRP